MKLQKLRNFKRNKEQKVEERTVASEIATAAVEISQKTGDILYPTYVIFILDIILTIAQQKYKVQSLLLHK